MQSPIVEESSGASHVRWPLTANATTVKSNNVSAARQQSNNTSPVGLPYVESSSVTMVTTSHMVTASGHTNLPYTRPTESSTDRYPH